MSVIKMTDLDLAGKRVFIRCMITSISLISTVMACTQQTVL